MDEKQLLHDVGLKSQDVLSIFLFGSRAYGNTTSQSDYDFILVIKEDTEENYKWKNFNWLFDHGWVARRKDSFYNDCKRDFYGRPEYQCWIYTPETFQKMLQIYVPFALECLFIPKENVWKNVVDFQFKLPINRSLLHLSYSTVAEMHFERARIEFETNRIGSAPEKGKYKLKIEPWNLRQSKKTLHHSLRILEFGCQLLETGKIYEISASNDLKLKILAVEGEDWESHLKVFLPLYNQLRQKLDSLKDIS